MATQEVLIFDASRLKNATISWRFLREPVETYAFKLPLVPFLSGTNTNDLINVPDENLAVPNLSSSGRFENGFYSVLGKRVINGDFNFHFGQEVDNVLGATIEFRVPFLTTETLDLGNG